MPPETMDTAPFDREVAAAIAAACRRFGEEGQAAADAALSADIDRFADAPAALRQLGLGLAREEFFGSDAAYSLLRTLADRHPHDRDVVRSLTVLPADSPPPSA